MATRTMGVMHVKEEDGGGEIITARIATSANLKRSIEVIEIILLLWAKVKQHLYFECYSMVFHFHEKS